MIQQRVAALNGWRQKVTHKVRPVKFSFRKDFLADPNIRVDSDTVLLTMFFDPEKKGTNLRAMSNLGEMVRERCLEAGFSTDLVWHVMRFVFSQPTLQLVHLTVSIGADHGQAVSAQWDFSIE